MSAPRLMVCADPLRRRPASASSLKSTVPLIVTRTSASFAIALPVTSEPTRAIRRTPGHVRAARTKDRTASSSSRRGSTTERLRLRDGLGASRFIAPNGYAVARATVRQKKTGRPVRFELTEQTRQAIDAYLKVAGKKPGKFLFTRPRPPGEAMS